MTAQGNSDPDKHTQTGSDPGRFPRWDPMVKLTHWTIAIAVLANALFTEEGSASHVWVGYALAAILALRLLWGIIGPVEARFSAFPPSPSRALRHVREIAAGRNVAHRSHNPLGALMVYAIWGTLLVVIATGISMAGLPGETKARGDGTSMVAELDRAGNPDPQFDDNEEDAERESADAEGESEHEGEDRGEEAAEEVHEVAANLLYVLILLHIAGVVFESRRQKRNLALAMLPGRG